MATSVRQIMTTDPITLPADTSAVEAARKMRDANIGAVIVQKEGTLCGIATDRDLVVRGVANNPDLSNTKLGGICTREPSSISPDDDVETVTTLMRERALRRIPVVEDGAPVGIVSMGDLAVARDEKSVLAAVSAAPPNR